MLNQKDNDVDDLFRRASEKYPLRTDSADWDRMAGALDNSPPDLPDEKKRRKRRFFWLFLLLPLAGVGYYAVRKTGVGDHPGVATVKTSPATSPAETSPTASTEKPGSETPAVETDPKGTGTSTAEKNDSARAAGKGNTVATGKGNIAAEGKENTPATDGDNSGAKGRNQTAVANAKPHRSTKNAAANTNTAAEGATTVAAALATTADDANSPRKAGFSVDRARTAGDYKLTVNVLQLPANKDSSKTRPKASPKQKSSFLYVGLLAGPDLSTVKFQKTTGVGSTFGVLLGYQFNKRWAVESGIYLDRKRYYTDAEYFDTKKLPPGAVQPNWYLKNMDGTCYMWEIPLNVRYNFSQGDRSKWFATAGLSTYLMTRENYDYNYNWWNGTTSGNTTKTWDLHQPSQYWFSIVNLSAGYEQRLGAIGNLRIEPYLRVPLSGIGTGNLNILSAGINIGIIRRL